MSYRIDYQATKKVRGVEKRTAGLPALAGACVLLLLAFWPPLRGLLIPGDPAVTVAALEELASELREGESVEAALEDFCRQVAEHGQP